MQLPNCLESLLINFSTWICNFLFVCYCFLFTHFSMWLSKIPITFYCEILLSVVHSLKICNFPASVQRSTVPCHQDWIKSNSGVSNERATQNTRQLLKFTVQPFRGERDWHRLICVVPPPSPFLLLSASWYPKCRIFNQLSVFNYTGNCQETFLRY